jgi:hypothetical protein
MRILLLIPLLLLHGCTTSIQKNSEAPKNTNEVFLRRVCHDVTSSSGQNGSKIIGKRSVYGKIRLLPLISCDETSQIVDSPIVIITTDTGENISTNWPNLEESMTVATKWKGHHWVEYRDRKKLRDQAATRFDSSLTYQIDLAMTYQHNSGINHVSILRVSKSRKIVIDRSICNIHGLRMNFEPVETCSACDYPEYFFLKQKKKFPNDGNYYSGCGSGSGEVWKCAACVRSYRAWAKKNGIK